MIRPTLMPFSDTPATATVRGWYSAASLWRGRGGHGSAHRLTDAREDVERHGAPCGDHQRVDFDLPKVLRHVASADGLQAGNHTGNRLDVAGGRLAPLRLGDELDERKPAEALTGSGEIHAVHREHRERLLRRKRLAQNSAWIPPGATTTTGPKSSVQRSPSRSS